VINDEYPKPLISSEEYRDSIPIRNFATYRLYANDDSQFDESHLMRKIVG